MLLNCGIGEDSWESLGLQGDPTSPSWRRSVLGVHWKDWCWSWNSNTLATWCEELTHWKRPWCWEGLGAGGEGDDTGWDGWMASLTRWTWVWVNLGISNGQGGLACCNSWGRKELDMTEQLNWTELNSWPNFVIYLFIFLVKYLIPWYLKCILILYSEKFLLGKSHHNYILFKVSESPPLKNHYLALLSYLFLIVISISIVS